MSMSRVLTVRIAAVVIGLALLPVPSRSGPEVGTPREGIRARAIHSHMKFLADDLLEGRETGSRGYQLAANYVAAQYEALGLEPGGDAGSYFQWIRFRRARQVEAECDFVLIDSDENEIQLVYGEDYFMIGDPVHESTRLETRMVFVGYGVTAPEMGYDDYEGVDVQGKIVVFLRGAPPTFHHNERAYYSSSLEKGKNAVAHGARGFISILKPEEAEKRPWEKRVVNSKIARMRGIGKDGEMFGVFPRLKVSAYLSPAGVERIFDDAPQSLDEVFEMTESGKPNSFELPLRARLSRRSVQSEARSCNVAGILRGSDPALRDEFVVYTGHLDHLGVGEEVDGDAIYNGFYDNASGIAVMIEVARAFSRLPEPPRRSILFLAVTGEEKGLLGSQFFAEYPTVPIRNIVADVNLDMFLMLNPLRDIVAFGAEHSSLEATVAEAAGRLGLTVSPDPMPEEVIFVRSDQYSFVKKGVPSVFLVGGPAGSAEAPEGGITPLVWRKEFYHSQRDDADQYIDLSAGQVFGQLNFIIGNELANDPQRPTWKEGDFFGERFASQAAD